VKNVLVAYKILATVVGISIITLICIGVPLEHLHNLDAGLISEGTTAQKLGKGIDTGLGIAHGFIYMGFVLVAFVLSRMARWPIIFTAVTLLCGTIPFLSFWAERRAIRDVEAKLAVGTPAAGSVA
jgi:integral membrane protein